MKKLILVLALLSTSVMANDFSCGDVEFNGEDFTLSVVEKEDGSLFYTINGEDTADIDENYMPRSNFFKSWKRLAGFFPSIGDGVEGYSVEVLVNKFLSTPALVKKVKFGLLEYRASGADGFYSIRFKCNRI